MNNIEIDMCEHWTCKRKKKGFYDSVPIFLNIVNQYKISHINYLS